MAESSGKGQAIKLAASILVILGAGYIFAARMSDKEDQAPDTEESKTQWICAKCGEAYEYTARDLEKQMVTAAAWRRNNPNPSESMTSARATILYCPKCKDNTVERALVCKVCGQPFSASLAEHGLVCPKCVKKGAPKGGKPPIQSHRRRG